MKSSTIRYRVADFLRQHPPFDQIQESDLLELVSNGRVKFHETDELIFRQGGKRFPYVFVVQQGSVQLVEQQGDRELLRDLRGVGDLVGIGQLVDETHYLESAKSVGDVMLYAIPRGPFFELIRKYPKAARYVAAFFSVKTDNSFNVGGQEKEGLRREGMERGRSSGWLSNVIPAVRSPQSTIASCHCEATIAEAAALMTNTWGSAVAVVDREGCVLGLVTRKILCNCIAAGEIDPEAPAASIMDRKPVFAPPERAAGDYLLRMVSSQKSHIAITRDGRNDSQLVELLDEEALTLHCGHSPVALSERIVSAESTSQLKSVRGTLETMLTAGLEDPSNMSWYRKTLTQFDAMIIRRIVFLAEQELAGTGLPSPGVDYSWLLFGVAGRRELLIHRKPRWGVIYADPDQSCEKQADEWFSALNAQVDKMVEEAGYPARDEKTWAHRSLSNWKEQFSRWIGDPIMSQTYLSLDMFDLSLLCGDNLLVDDLQSHIHKELGRNSNQFIRLMANDAMAQLPPLTFFQGQVVEDDGERHDQFDLRHTTLQPLTDMARVFSLEQGEVSGAPTDLRLERYAELHPAEEKLFRQAAESFRVALRLQAMVTLEHKDEVQQVDPLEFDKYDQQLLKSVFRDILALLNKSANHFQLVPRR